MFYRRKKAELIRMEVGDFQVEVTFKPIKNMYLKVSRMNGGIRVSAPSRTPAKIIKKFVLSRDKWIRKNLSGPGQKQQELNYEDGEIHRYFGLKVPLKVDYVKRNINAYLHNNVIMLQVKEGFSSVQREKTLDELYRRELKKLVGELIQKWEPVMAVEVKSFGIRKMKTRWGTCNINDQRIWLNLHLAKEKPEVIEMVVVHEMVHLLERLHNKRFYGYMDKFLPDWKERSAQLESGIIC